MAKYSYKAINDNGATIKGEIEASAPSTAKDQLSEQGLIPLEVKLSVDAKGKSGAGGFFSSGPRVKAPELILFTKQFRTMFKAGIPLVRVLQILGAQTPNSTLKAVTEAMYVDITQGLTISEAMARHPKVFPPLYSNIAMAGEKSGSLPEVLNRLIYIIEHEENVKKNIKSALQYPTIVVIVLVLAFIVLLTFVMPKFAAIFMKANIELPLPTKIIMKIYDIFTIYWYMMLSSVLTTITLIKLYIKTEQGLFVKDTILLKLPIFGPLFLKSAMSRFASIFATLQASGVPVVDSIAMLSATIGNAAISRSFVQISK